MSNQYAVQELKQQAERMEEKGNNMGEDLGAPYREAAEKLHEIANRYADSAQDRSDSK